MHNVSAQALKSIIRSWLKFIKLIITIIALNFETFGLSRKKVVDGKVSTRFQSGKAFRKTARLT